MIRRIIARGNLFYRLNVINGWKCVRKIRQQLKCRESVGSGAWQCFVSLLRDSPVFFFLVTAVIEEFVSEQVYLLSVMKLLSSVCLYVCLLIRLSPWDTIFPQSLGWDVNKKRVDPQMKKDHRVSLNLSLILLWISGWRLEHTHFRSSHIM